MMNGTTISWEINYIQKAMQTWHIRQVAKN